MKILRLCFCLTLFSAAVAEEPDLIQSDIRFFPIARSPVQDLFYETEPGVFEPVIMRSRVRSDPHPYEGISLFSLYNRFPSSDPEQEYIYRRVTSVQLPDSAKEVLIFLLPPTHARNPEDNRWIILALNDTAEGFPPGTLKVLNATGVRLDGVVGEQVFSLGLEISEAKPFNVITTDRSGSIDIVFALNLGESHEMVYANRLRFNPSMRSILVLRPPRRPGSIQIDSFLIEDSLVSSRDSDDLTSD